MRLLWFNLATDVDDPVLGFTSRWIQAIATKVERIHVITMRAGRIELPENVRCDSVGKEAGYSRPRRIVEFYRILLEVLRNEPVDACFSHMFPLFTVPAAPLLRPKGVPIVTWYAHPSPSCPKTRTERQGRILEAFSKLAETSRRGTGSAIGEPEQTSPADPSVPSNWRARTPLLCGVAVVIAEQAAQSLTTSHLPVRTADAFFRFEQRVPEPLMVALSECINTSS